MKESDFQKELKDELKARFPGCIILKNDPSQIGGIPDLTILWNRFWAFLECKASNDASHRPRQDYYIKKANEMSFASFISPENREEVLNDLERSFKGL